MRQRTHARRERASPSSPAPITLHRCARPTRSANWSQRLPGKCFHRSFRAARATLRHGKARPALRRLRCRAHRDGRHHRIRDLSQPVRRCAERPRRVGDHGGVIAGGVVALLGAFVFAELAARRPCDGALYAYMRDAYHPVVAFMYGWTLLLVSQSGGMAAAALTFAGYFEPLTGLRLPPQLLAFAVLAIFTIVNCLGVREGSNVQNFFMVLKIAAIAGLIAVGLFAHPSAGAAPSAASSMNLIGAMAVSMIAVLFAYSGWQTSSFMTGELKNPERTLPLGMLWGVAGVIVLYVLVNVVCLRVLGPAGLMHTDAPA